ncbi:cytochrome c oxidase assembly protein [Acrocarpospora macrocephala]|uniref:Copper resistance protein D n=1 Tax=Acrocarpospora macrocephala TaxID=150177 RepID=A0A5M3WYX2_9ACTN|nr:cytochrome c oxidase assembly protein [Acrocarpospora macrocephala]GES14164.1 copper resistance protein D [Acrocarpospora macrocephala]
MTTPRSRGGTLAFVGALAALAVLLLALWFGGGTPAPTIAGLPSPGSLTRWGLPIVRLVHDICAVATVGILVVSVIAAQDAKARASLAQAAGRWAVVWTFSASLTALLTLSDFLGLPVGEAVESGVLPTFLFNIPQGQAFLIVTVLALAVSIGVLLPLGTWGRVALLATAVVTVLPPAYAGHSASAADHNLAVSSLMLHIAAVTIWVGGLLALVLLLRDSTDLVTTVRRFSALALCCYIAVGVSGTINAWVRVGGLEPIFTTRYGLLILAKIAALLVLGWFGWRHRRTTIEAMSSGDTRAPFLRLAAGEIVVMLATVGLAVGLSRTAPPPSEVELTTDNTALGYVLSPFSPGGLLTQIRPDPILLLIVVGLAVAYLAGVRRLAQPWPPARTAAWLGGLLILLYAMTGGLAAYAPAIFSIHAVQYGLLGTLGPALLVFGAPLTLYQEVNPSGQARIDSPLGRALSHPWTALGLYGVPLLALYLTPFFDLAQSSLAVRLVLQVIVVLTGFIFFATAIGEDPLPRPIVAIVRTRILAAALALNALITFVLLIGPSRGDDWYVWLDLVWAPDRETDQQLGAMLALAFPALTIITLMLLLMGRWRTVRQLSGKRQ